MQHNPITTAEADERAKKLWGGYAAAKDALDGTKMLFADYPYIIRGRGATWEEAFAQDVAIRLLGENHAA